MCTKVDSFVIIFAIIAIKSKIKHLKSIKIQDRYELSINYCFVYS